MAPLFKGAGKTVSVIIHNDFVTVLLKADDPDTPVQVSTASPPLHFSQVQSEDSTDIGAMFGGYACID